MKFPRINSLFGRLFTTFVSLFLFLFLFLSLSIEAGFRTSQKRWDLQKQKELADLALTIVTSPDSTETLPIPFDIPFMVYDSQKNLLFSNRGMQGMRMGSPWNGSMGPGMLDRSRQPRQEMPGPREPNSSAALLPLIKEGVLLGYYTGIRQFQADPANLVFLRTFQKILFISLIVSLSLVGILSFFLSRGLSKPAKQVAANITEISKGNYNVTSNVRGSKEITGIVDAANSLKNQLIREKELRSQWAQDIAHDLRTPLSALKAQFEAFRDGILSPSNKRMETILEELSRIEILVNDLEELMQLESPEIKLEKKILAVEPLLSVLKSRFSWVLEQKGIEISVKTFVKEIYGSETLLERAFSNILSNALRHTHQNGKIEIVFKEGEKDTIITISNTGDPIPEKELPKLFDRLYRGEFARKTPGSGLGLTIAKRIIELHGGAIIIDSISGTTVVTMTIKRRFGGIFQENHG